jgi:hypothetical protein
MITHEECVVRREQGVQIADRSLVVGGPVAELDERLLARKCFEDGLFTGAGGKIR